MGADSKQRSVSLDVLRGVAALMVIVNHSDVAHVPGIPELNGLSGFIYWRLRLLGWSGVDFFFVLSGFLIGGLLIAELEKTGTIQVGRFLLRRGLKLWPSYFVLLIVLAATGTTHWLDTSSLRSLFVSLGTHVFFLQNYLDLGGNGPTWSLAVEEHFYTVLPFVLLTLVSSAPMTLRRFGGFVLAVLVACLVLRIVRVWTGFDPEDFMRTHFRIDSLLFGVFCQYLWRTKHPALLLLLAHRKPMFAVSVLLIAPAIFLSRGNPFMFTMGFFMLTLGYAGILMLLVSGAIQAFEKRLPIRALASTGRISYNLYLWHFFLPALVYPIYAPVQLAVSSIPAPAPIIVIVQIAAYAAFAIAAGYLGTILIERPFLRLRDRLVRSRFQAV